MTVGILLTKVTERPMHSLMMAHNGLIPTTMDMETILFQHLKEMHVQTHMEQVSKTDSVALMETVMVILTKVMNSQQIANNGLILIQMAMAIITTMMFNNLLSCT